ncbi:ABC1 kinase family protein [Thiolapillus sp.]
MTDIPTGKLARSGVAGVALMRAGGKRLKHAAKRPFLSESAREQSRRKLDDETAELLFDAFSRLRGTALKIAQMLSMETSFLPESFRKELSKSYHQVPPLGRPLVRKLIVQEFGQPPEKVFAHFDANAFAAASLGQVHTAKDAQGDKLAVKLQYPGIDVTIDNDLQLVRSLVKRTRHARLMLSSLDEIERRLREEVDYRKEAENTRWFRQKLTLDDVVIPAVHAALSSRRVLSTDRLDGLHLDQWLAKNPSQEQRDHFGQLLYDVFVRSFYGLHALHADPNPGNYLFMDDGKLGLVDFGCVKHFSPKFVELMPRLLRAYMDRDSTTVVKTYEKLGMVAKMTPDELRKFYDETLQPFGDWITRPFKEESFDFGSRQSASYTADGWDAIGRLSGVDKINGLADEFIFFDRTFFGLYQLFERMGARVRMRHQWLS